MSGKPIEGPDRNPLRLTPAELAIEERCQEEVLAYEYVLPELEERARALVGPPAEPRHVWVPGALESRCRRIQEKRKWSDVLVAASHRFEWPKIEVRPSVDEPAKPKETTFKFDLDSSHPTHRNTVEALREATRGKDIKVFGFGEVHARKLIQKGNKDIPTTFTHFVKEIVPFLVKEKGVSVIGIKHLPSNTGPEIEYYLKTGKIDPHKIPVMNLLARDPT